MKQGSSIINITSIGSKLAFPNNPGYQASKAGLAALTRSLAYDLSLKNMIHTLWFLLLVFCLLIEYGAIQKIDQNRMFFIGYPLTENVENH